MSDDAEDLVSRLLAEIGHAIDNDHHLAVDCQGVDFRLPPPPAVRVDYVEAVVDGWRRHWEER